MQEVFTKERELLQNEGKSSHFMDDGGEMMFMNKRES